MRHKYYEKLNNNPRQQWKRYHKIIFEWHPSEVIIQIVIANRIQRTISLWSGMMKERFLIHTVPVLHPPLELWLSGVPFFSYL